MNPFAFLCRKRSAEQRAAQGLRAELQPLQPVYPPRRLSLPALSDDYPRVTSLEAHGLGAYLLSAHLDAQALAQVEQLIEQQEFLKSRQTGVFRTLSQSGSEGDSVSLQGEPLGEGISVVLVSNSISLLQALPGLAPPAPWQVFPEVDAETLGSLQGNLAHWWQNYWWPYWQSLDPKQRKQWFENPAHPQDWCDYLKLQDALNGNDTEVGA
ncbi:hypothetical protein D3C78_721910 [compost metagenome]